MSITLFVVALTIIGAGLFIRENGHRLTGWACLAIGLGLAGMTAALNIVQT